MKANLRSKAAAECIGTFTLVFAGCGAIMANALYPDSVPTAVIPMVFGFVVAAMIYATGHISGAHMNPAVTLAFAAVKRFAWRELPAYWLAQITGAVLAVAMLAFTLPEAARYGATVPSLPLAGAFLWEALLSFFLMFVIIAVATDSRAVGVMAGAAIGAVVAVDAFIGGVFTGASMNPARSLAPALFAGELGTAWLYCAAPCLGTVLAAFTYDAIRCDAPSEKKQVKGCC